MKSLLRPKYLIIAIIGVYLAIMGAVTALDSPQANIQPVQAVETVEPVQDTPLDPREIHRLVNAERTKRGLGELKIDDRLNETAKQKCEDMAKYKYYGHHNNKTGVSGVDYMIQPFPTVNRAENLNQTNSRQTNAYSSNESFVESWMNSDSHRAVILDAQYTYTGIATCMADGKKTTVQHFISN